MTDHRVVNIYRLKGSPDVIHMMAHKTPEDAERKRLVTNDDWQWVAVVPIEWIEQTHSARKNG